MNETIQILMGQIPNQQQFQNVISVSYQYDKDYLFNSSKTSEYYYKIKELNLMYSSLGYSNDSILELGIDIITNCFSQNKFDIKISKTGENEILIFREEEGVFNNIIIDEDGDIEYLHIPVDRRNTQNEYFPFIYYTNMKDLIAKL